MPVQVDRYTSVLMGMTRAVCHQFALFGFLGFQPELEAKKSSADENIYIEMGNDPNAIVRTYLSPPNPHFNLRAAKGSGIYLCAGMKKGEALYPPDHWWIRTNHYLYDTVMGQPLRRVPYIAGCNNWPPHYCLLAAAAPLRAELAQYTFLIGEVEVETTRLRIARQPFTVGDPRRAAINALPASWQMMGQFTGGWQAL